MENQLNDEQKRLAEENHNLIYSFAKKYNVDLEEHYGLLAIALCNAAREFDSEKDTRFSTLAYNCMSNEISKYYKLLNRRKRIPSSLVVSCDMPIESEYCDSTCSYIDAIPDDKSTQDIVESEMLKTNLLNLLNGTDRIVLEYIFNGITQKEISEKLNCTRQMINLRMWRIRRKCEDYLDKYVYYKR